MSFMTLPRELRLHIHQLVIETPIEPPSCPSASQHGRVKTSSWSGRKAVITLRPQNPALGLLLANKQLHEEMNHVQARAKKDYEVDIMYVKTYGLWTTWTQIPVLPTTDKIDTVRATFRMFEPTSDLSDEFRNVMSYSCPQPCFEFYELLTRLIRYGPGYISRDRTGHGNGYIVKKIHLNVVAPTDGAPHTSIFFPENYGRYPSLSSDGYRYDKSPAMAVGELLKEMLSKLLSFSYDMEQFAYPLVENIVDGIVVSVEGEVLKRFNIDDCWEEGKARMEVRAFSAPETDALSRWKAWANWRRRCLRIGLPPSICPPVQCLPIYEGGAKPHMTRYVKTPRKRA